MKKQLTVQDLGLTPEEIKRFVTGARLAYGNALPSTPLAPAPSPMGKPFTNPKPRK